MSPGMDGRDEDSPFHAGELAIQSRVGVRDKIAKVERQVFRDHLPEQHRAFFAQLPFVIVGAVDRQGQPWATALAHALGFIESPDPRHLLIQARPTVADPLASLLQDGLPVGLLGMDPISRRRNRMNGVIDALPAGGFSVLVHQSFGNCPKYIQARQPIYIAALADQAAYAAHDSTRLDEADQRLIASSDCFFIASAHPAAQGMGSRSNGVDVSHRGGKPGFVRVDNDTKLTVPDFLGNYFFNTLGNVTLNPRVGLVFMDFERAGLLYIAADAYIVWDGPDLAAYAGAQRLMRLEIRQVRRINAALPLRWSASSPSPYLAQTGEWPGSV